MTVTGAELTEAERWMQRAMELARKAVALASPNPMVGAVVAGQGEAAGEGFHTYEGKKHGEILALEQAGERARGATLYLNLEPCCHTGRTGPCTEAVIAAGISRVVAAIEDPNPQVAGKGFAALRRAGIEVETGVCREQAERLNEDFACWIRQSRPLVTLKTAMTLDGWIAAPEDNAGWISSEQARLNVQRQRHGQDAIWTGIGTVLADDPLLTDRSGLKRRRLLLRVVMDSKLRLPVDARMLQEVDRDLLVVCGKKADKEKKRQLEERGVEVIELGEGERPDMRPDLGAVLDELGRREMTSLLLEAGAGLNGAALEAGVVDKLFLYYAPKILAGGEGMPMAAGRGVRNMRDAMKVRSPRVHEFGENFAVEGYLRDVYRDH